jgi:hypothetical protein
VSRRTPWRPPTRRAFVALLGGAAASLALPAAQRLRAEPSSPLEPEPEPPEPVARPIWIGHA